MNSFIKFLRYLNLVCPCEICGQETAIPICTSGNSFVCDECYQATEQAEEAMKNAMERPIEK